MMSLAQEHELVDAARDGDEDAFRRVLEPYRGELNAHCYRILGSVHDAEDALQETSLRAWRGLRRFEGRSSLRSWLYTIATNTSLNLIARRPKRIVPVDYGPAADPHEAPGVPLAETVWIEPYPDDQIGIEEVGSAPEAHFQQREALELAFVAALQHLPARQRAALILREVLGFSAKETAESLDTTVASVNSALQRARSAVDERLPEQSQQETLRSLGDERLAEIVNSYMDAMERGDVDKVVGMLAEDAAWSMPPLSSWYRGHEGIAGFLRVGPLSGQWRWAHRAAWANGQPAIAAYTWRAADDAFSPFALDVLTFDGDRISEITSFIARTADGLDADAIARFPDEPPDPVKVEAIFERLGLPTRLD